MLDHIIRKPLVKLLAFLLSVVLVVATGLTMLAFSFCSAESFYLTGNSGIYHSTMISGVLQSTAYNMLRLYVNQGDVSEGEASVLRRYPPTDTNLRFQIIPEEEDGDIVTNTSEDETDLQYNTWYGWYVLDKYGGLYYLSLESQPGLGESYYSDGYLEDNQLTMYNVTIRLAVADPLVAADQLSFLIKLYNGLFEVRYPLILILTGGLILTVIVHILLFCGCGRRVGSDAVYPGWQEKIPLDVYICLYGFGIIFTFSLAASAWDSINYGGSTDLYFSMMISGIFMLLGVILSELTACSLAIRFKMRGWWKNMLVWKLTVAFFRLLKKLWDRLFSGIARTLGQFFLSLPFVWRGVFAAAGILLLEVLLTLLFLTGSWTGLFICLGVNLAVLVAAGMLLGQMRQLLDAGKRMADGDFDFRVDTAGMLQSFREHGDDLNAISEGMIHAVDQKMRSERMKTELITNVSHDIKTPLTSIVNYADLLSKEKPENERMKEYIAALSRQSSRLRKLIEDLVEASKASTGNLSVDLQPCELGVLIEQTAGEYQERLEQNGLELVVEAPEQPVEVLADSRRIWRVLDNLMGNICKYALSGTRVYITLEKDDCARLTLRNISRDRLGISADELMERFVRGDTSRSTEGSGLGLSIARSLMELQHGKLELKVDGDLFKAVLTLPLMDKSQQQPSAHPEKTSSSVQEPDELELTVQPSSGKYGMDWAKDHAAGQYMSNQSDNGWHTPEPRVPSPNRYIRPAAEKKQDRRERRKERTRRVEQRVEKRMNHVFKSIFEPLDDNNPPQN